MTTSGYGISIRQATPRAIACVRTQLPAARVSSSFAQYLNQVYALGRDGTIQLDGQNIFVYRAGVHAGEVDVEFGVGVNAPFSPSGLVTYSQLPVGEVAVTQHTGDYSKLGVGHAAVIDYCRSNGRQLAGARWEIYGHWNEDPRLVHTDIYYLLLHVDSN